MLQTLASPASLVSAGRVGHAIVKFARFLQFLVLRSSFVVNFCFWLAEMAEVFGVAASAIGLVSFPLQLLKAVQEIHSLLAHFKGAREEILRLVEKLSQLEGILQDVENIAEMQKVQRGTPELPLTVYDSLKACEKDLGPLKALVENVKRDRGSPRIKGKWASFKTVYKEKDINIFEKRLNRSIQLLMMSMVANENILRSVDRSQYFST